jgi:hypothetical protein
MQNASRMSGNITNSLFYSYHIFREMLYYHDFSDALSDSTKLLKITAMSHKQWKCYDFILRKSHQRETSF